MTGKQLKAVTLIVLFLSVVFAPTIWSLGGAQIGSSPVWGFFLFMNEMHSLDFVTLLIEWVVIAVLYFAVKKILSL